MRLIQNTCTSRIELRKIVILQALMRTLIGQLTAFDLCKVQLVLKYFLYFIFHNLSFSFFISDFMWVVRYGPPDMGAMGATVKIE